MKNQRLLNLTSAVLIRRAAMSTLLLAVISCVLVLFFEELSADSFFRTAAIFVYTGPALLFFQANCYGRLDASLLLSFSVSRRDTLKAEFLGGILCALFAWLMVALCLLITAGRENPLLVTRPYFLIYAAAVFLFSSMFGLYSSFFRSRIVQALHLVIILFLMVVSGLCCFYSENNIMLRMNLLVPGVYIGFLIILAAGAILSVWLMQKKIRNLIR